MDKTPAVLMLLSRGDAVDVVGAYDEEHLIIKTANGYGLVQNQFLRTEGTEPYETWTGYAYADTEVFSDVWFLTEPVRTLSRNEEVEVLEELNHGYLIRIEETEGFVSKDGISRAYLSSGWSGGSGSSSGGSTGADGGDISLAFYGGGRVLLLSAIDQSGDVTGTATVLCDGAPVVLGYFDREDIIPLVTEEGFAPTWEGYWTVYLNGLYAYVQKALVLAPGEEAFALWEGYSASNTQVYRDNTLLGDPISTLNVNTEITVLWELENCYVIQAGDVTGCIAKEQAGADQFYVGSWSGGSSSSGSSGGDWTPPAL
jgi:hypothetical protein